MNKKSNIILLMMDQLSEKWLCAALNGACELPNFKRLIESGVKFNNMYSENPVCCPARATIATGLSTRGHGVLENGYQLDPKLPTFMKALQTGGYQTGLFGKLHVEPHYKGLNPDYKQYGFDVTHVTEDCRGGEWLDWIQKEHPEYLEEVLMTIWANEIPEYLSYGENHENLRERIKACREKHDRTNGGKYPHASKKGYELPFPKELSQTEWITQRAIDFMKNRETDQPFFAQISYVQPHGPFTPPAGYLDKVRDDMIPDVVLPEWADDENAPYCIKGRGARIKMTPDQTAFNRKCYFADLIHLDEQVGKILDCLEEINQKENTYIVFVSDHGELLGDHGFYGKEEKHYDACIHIPLVISGPGLESGITKDQMVQHTDICPTILEMAHVKMPLMPKEGPHLKVEQEDIPSLYGRSLMGLCQGKDISWRQESYCESYNGLVSADPRDWARTIRTNEYRYTYYPSGGGEQLFNLVEDPDETVNLAGDPRYEKQKGLLKDLLLEYVILQDYPKTRRDLYALGVH